MERRQLRQVPIGKAFMVGNQLFIKFTDDMNGCVVVARDTMTSYHFGTYNNNFAESDLRVYLNGDFLVNFETQLDYLISFTTMQI